MNFFPEEKLNLLIKKNILFFLFNLINKIDFFLIYYDILSINVKRKL